MKITVNFIKDCLVSKEIELVKKIEHVGKYLAITYQENPFDRESDVTTKIDGTFIQGVTIDGMGCL